MCTNLVTDYLREKFDKDTFNLIKAERAFEFTRFKFIKVSLVKCMCMDIKWNLKKNVGFATSSWSTRNDWKYGSGCV